MKIIFNHKNNEVVGVNRDPLPYEFSLNLSPAPFMTKEIDEVIGKVQKKSQFGELLYKDNIKFNIFNEESFDEVTYKNKPTEFTHALITERLVNSNEEPQTKEMAVKVPIKFENLEPVMVDNIVKRTVSLEKDPFYFTYNEILEFKKKLINNSQLADLIFYDEVFEIENISTNLSSHSADLSKGTILLHPNGQCRLEKIKLSKTISSLEIYSELEEGIDIEIGISASNFSKITGVIHVLSEPTNSIYIRFNNTTDEIKRVNAIGILA